MVWWLITWGVAMVSMLGGMAAGRAIARQTTIWGIEDVLRLWLLTGFLIGLGLLQSPKSAQRHIQPQSAP